MPERGVEQGSGHANVCRTIAMVVVKDKRADLCRRVLLRRCAPHFVHVGNLKAKQRAHRARILLPPHDFPTRELAVPPSETPSRICRRVSLSTSTKPRAGSVSTVTPLSMSRSARPGSISRTNSTIPTSFSGGAKLSIDTKTGSVSGVRSPSVSVANRRLSAIPTGSGSTTARARPTSACQCLQASDRHLPHRASPHLPRPRLLLY